MLSVDGVFRNYAGGFNPKRGNVWTAMRRSTHVNHPMAFLQRRDEGGQGALEGGEEGLLAAVAEAHSHERAVGSGLVGQMQEVFILADQSAALRSGVVPDVRVVGLVHLQVEDMLGVMSA
jgi:hypothetical protein